LRDGATDAEPVRAEHEPLYRRISFADILEVPPPPPSFDPALLALLKDKYRLVFERLDPAEGGGDEYRSGSQDLVKAWAGETVADPARGPSGAVRGGQDCALLQTLLDANGIRASFNHDTVERLLVDRKAVREGAGVVVGRALNALRDSVRERAAHGVNEPTWTGKHGNAGRPVEDTSPRAVKCASSSSTTRSGGRGNRGTTSGRGRQQTVPTAAPSAEICEGVERLAAQGLTLTDTIRELAEAILRSFLHPQLAGPDRRLTTSQVLQHLAANVTAEQRHTFKSLLGRMCTLAKSESPEVPGIWTLRPELRPRGVARASG